AIYFDLAPSITITASTVSASPWVGVRIYDLVSASVTDSTFDGNAGGGINTGLSKAGSVLATTGSTFVHNSNYAGGGVYSDAATTVVKNSTFVDNTATGGGTNGGGAVWASGSLAVYSSTIVHNTAYGTGAGGILAYAGAAITLQSSIVANNSG